MKNRKKVVVALLLVCVLCLGVGYAALTDNLIVNGTVNFLKNANAEATFAANVHFVDGSASVNYTGTTTGVSSGVSTEVVDEDADPKNVDDKLNITVDNTVLAKAGDKVTISVDIINASTDYGAKITLNAATSTGTNLGTLYSVTSTWATGDTGTIAKGGTNTNTVEITIELLKTPTEDVVADTFTITYVAESVE